jgi:hypothetical protein
MSASTWFLGISVGLSVLSILIAVFCGKFFEKFN